MMHLLRFTPLVPLCEIQMVSSHTSEDREGHCVLAKVCKPLRSPPESPFVGVFLSCVRPPETEDRELLSQTGVNLLCLAELFSSFCQLLN